MRLAQDAVRALAAGDHEQIMTMANAADRDVLAWAFGTVLQDLRQATALYVNGDARKLRRALLSAANGMDLDVVATQATVMLQEDAAHP